jgi:nucleoid-associated protein YgaU
LTVALLSVLDGYAVCRFVPVPSELLRDFAAPHAWVARVGSDAAIGTAAGALLWLVALWFAIGLGATLIAARTGRRHGLLAAVSRRATPALLRRLVIASTGASIALSPVTALATGIEAAPPSSGSIAIGWPSDPVPGVPASPAAAAQPKPSAPAGAIPAPPVVGTTPAPPLDPNPERPSTVLVKPGDSLWRITALRLGPRATDRQIAQDWPDWYRQNRPVIGRDPNLLRPGQQLAVPTAEGKD